MGLIREVVDAIELVANSIENIQKIADAVRDGVGYLQAKHPEVREDLLEMCGELSKTLEAMASASSVVTHFSFTVAGSDVDRQPGRFNDYMIAYKPQAERVKQQIESLRGHCHVVRQHAENLDQAANRKDSLGLGWLLGLRSKEREEELAQRISRIWQDEQEVYGTVEAMAGAVRSTMDAVQSALGGPGQMDPANVPTAASVLSEHAVEFSKLESQCNYAAGRLKEAIQQLGQ